MSDPRLFREIQRAVHQTSLDHGWWDAHLYDGQVQVSSVPVQVIGLKLMLAVTELAEAMEEARKSRDYCPYRGPDQKPEGFDIELADAVIRIMDLAEALAIDLEAAILEKHAYNQTRPHRHGGKLA